MNREGPYKDTALLLAGAFFLPTVLMTFGARWPSLVRAFVAAMTRWL